MRKFRPTTVSWYGNFHVKVCVIIHIWGEVIVSLCKNGVVEYVVELLMEV